MKILITLLLLVVAGSTSTSSSSSSVTVQQAQILKMSTNQLDDLWSKSKTPDRIPQKGNIVGTALQVSGSKMLARLMNLFYMGDTVKYVCKSGVAIADVLILGNGNVQGLWFLLPDKTNTTYPATGLISDFTQPIWTNCDGPGQLMARNSWPFNTLFDIWRQVPGSDRLLLGKMFKLVKPYESKSYGFILLDVEPLKPWPIQDNWVPLDELMAEAPALSFHI